MKKLTELDILKTAILNEVEGFQFYTMAAARADDAEVAAAFQNLAQEEQQHEAWLRKMYQQVASAGEADVAEITANASSPQIFRQQNVVPESGSLEISVYKIGILMEMASLQFYNSTAEQAQNPALKELLHKLARWEDTHLLYLQQMYDILKEEWWDKQGFSPA
ncbi:MAG: ferritin family protein [Firmicutes bacterium]|nr:ferritin family protein [Bacillota bacterium]